MNIGLIVLGVVTVSLVVGPMMMLRPNLAQQGRERLRSLALARGVHISRRNLPQQADQIEKPEPISVYFCAPSKTQYAQNWLLLRTHYQHDLHVLGWWSWQTQEQASGVELALLQQYLPLLPDSIRAVGGGDQGAAVYWTEVGGEGVLEQVIQLLEQLNMAESAS
jgi:hypothetical protein